MARKSNGTGHNSGGEPLTEDDEAALQLHHTINIRRLLKTADEKKAAYDTARSDVNGAFALLKGDLRYSRKEFEEVLEAQNQTEAEFLHAEAKRARRFALQGLPIGHQLDMFKDGPAVGDTADDAAHAYAVGRRKGLLGDEPVFDIDPIFLTDAMRGWHEGQEENILKLGRASAIIAERERAAGKLTEDEDEPEVEEDPTDPEVVAAKARKLKKSGWTEPTPAEAEFEDA